MSDDAVTVPCQGLENAVLKRREPDLSTAAPLHHTARQVDRQAAKFENAARQFTTHMPAQRRAHSRQQLWRTEGFEYVIVGADFKRRESLPLSGSRRQHDNRRGRPSADGFDELDTIVVR